MVSFSPYPGNRVHSLRRFCIAIDGDYLAVHNGKTVQLPLKIFHGLSIRRSYSIVCDTIILKSMFRELSRELQNLLYRCFVPLERLRDVRFYHGLQLSHFFLFAVFNHCNRGSQFLDVG